MATPRFNPFPGLRPFAMDEKHLFFGREQQTAEILVRLREHRFIAAVGSSGSGKSSLIRAGLLPELYGGTMRAAGTHWRVAVMRPGADPIANTAQALCEADLYDLESDPDAPLRVGVTLKRSGLGLVEAVRQAGLPERTNLLLVVDQFEEIFRYTRKTPAAQEASATFVRLLLEASQQASQSIYVVLTMRSDFLGDCSRYRGLAEAINRSEYLIPRLNRDQWRSAIEGPVRVGGGEIAPRLVQRLLNDVGEDPDQLPLLQHALMRTWDHWVAHRRPDEPIDLEHYEAVGGMNEALSRHADEAYAELPGEPLRGVAARVFKALTEKSLDARGTRRPTRLGELVSIAGTDEANVTAVVEAFRQMGRTFLMPPVEVPLEAETVVDISHESLMRAWRRLRDWCDEEALSARIYRRLGETALLWKDRQAGLYRDPDLQIALRWREENGPNSAWAERQGPGFNTAIEFLEASAQAGEAERAAAEAARRRELDQAQALAESERARADVQARAARRLRWFAAALAGLAILALWGWHRAVLADKKGRSGDLTARAEEKLGTDPEESVRLASEAYRVYPTPQARDKLRISLFASLVRARMNHPTNADNAERTDFSADGRLLFTATETGEVGVWRTGESNLWFRSAHEGPLLAAGFASNAQHLLTVGKDNWARRWPVMATTPSAGPDAEINLATLAGGTDEVLRAAISPGRNLLAVGSARGTTRVWDLARLWLTNNPAAPRELGDGNTNAVASLAFSDDGAWLVTVNEGSEANELRIWEVTSGKPFKLSGALPTERVFEARLSPDRRRLLSLGYPEKGRQKLQVFDLHPQEGDPIELGLTHLAELTYSETVTSASFSPDGELILTSGGQAAQIKTLADTEAARFLGHKKQVNAAVFSPDGRWILSASADRTVRLWTNPTGRLLLPPQGRNSLLAVACAGPVTVTRAAQPAEPLLAVREALPRPASPLSATSPGERAAPWAEPAELFEYRILPPTPADAAGLSRDGKFLALLLDEGTTIAVADLARRRAAGVSYDLRQRPTNGIVWLTVPAKARGVVLSEDARWISTAGEDRNVYVWRNPFLGVSPLRTPDRTGIPGPRIYSLGTNAAAIRTLGFVPDRDPQQVFAVTEDAVEAWDLAATQSKPRTLAMRTAGVPQFRCAAFDPVGRFLTTGCREGVTCLSCPPAPLRPRLEPPHSTAVNAVAWHPDGRLFITASGDKTAALWWAPALADRSEVLQIGVLRGHASPLSYAAFAADDRSVITAGYDGSVRVFEWPEECLGSLDPVAVQRLRQPLEARGAGAR